jgi:hypothetical protein
MEPCGTIWYLLLSISTSTAGLSKVRAQSGIYNALCSPRTKNLVPHVLCTILQQSARLYPGRFRRRANPCDADLRKILRMP